MGHLVRTLLVGGLVLATAAPAVAGSSTDHGDRVPARFETSVDGEMRNDENALGVAFSQTANNARPSIVTVGMSRKLAVLEAAGIRDYDTLATAVDAETGEVLWATRHDSALNVTDRPVAVEVPYNNNFVYVTSEANGATTLLELAMRDGEVLAERPLPGVVEDSAINASGSWLFQVGTDGGDLQVTGFETAPDTISIDDQPVAGRAYAVDMHQDYSSGTVAAWRTAVVTGQETVFGSGGDAYTAAYRTDSKQKIWERRWASPGNRLDTGVAVDMTHVAGTDGVAFVTGRTFTADRGFDTWVTALDAQTGESLWSGDDGMRFFDGAGDDDEPVAVAYSPSTDLVYVTGTSERGVPQARDVVVLAYDATTGDHVATGYAHGTISNGDDRPTGIVVAPDGKVLVSAHVHDLEAPRYRAGVFAFDALLRPAGNAFLSGGDAATDQAADIGLSIDGTEVLVGGAADLADTELDHVAAAWPLDEFRPTVVDPEPLTPTVLTLEVEEKRQLDARLTDDEGTPLAGRELVFSYEDGTEIARHTTDVDGRVSFKADKDKTRDKYPVFVVTFGGDEVYESSTTSASDPEADDEDEDDSDADDDSDNDSGSDDTDSDDSDSSDDD